MEDWKDYAWVAAVIIVTLTFSYIAYRYGTGN